MGKDKKKGFLKLGKGEKVRFKNHSIDRDSVAEFFGLDTDLGINQGEIKEDSDLLMFSKGFTKSMCAALSSPPKDFDVEEMVENIGEYLTNSKSIKRLLYSEISVIIYEMTDEEQGNFNTNIESLLDYSIKQYSASDVADAYEDTHKLIFKLYDHFHLAVKQKTLSVRAEKTAETLVAKSVKAAEEKVTNEVVEKMEREYITILGIFSSIVIAFVASLVFSSSVLNNIHQASIYRLTFIVCLLGLIVYDTLFMLFKYLYDIVGKGDKINFKCFKKVNKVGVVLCVLIFVAWLADLIGLKMALSEWLNWAARLSG